MGAIDAYQAHLELIWMAKKGNLALEETGTVL